MQVLRMRKLGKIKTSGTFERLSKNINISYSKFWGRLKQNNYFTCDCWIYIDYFIESATYGFLFTSCKTLENSLACNS